MNTHVFATHTIPHSFHTLFWSLYHQSFDAKATNQKARASTSKARALKIRCCLLYEFNNRGWGCITATDACAKNAGVPTVAGGKLWRNFFKQFFQYGTVMNVFANRANVVQRATFGGGDEALHVWAEFLGFGEGRFDSTFADERCGLSGRQSAAVARGAAESSSGYTVTHNVPPMLEVVSRA
jgi:hypothetical protein